MNIFPRDLRSSGDLIADRRYLHAQAAAEGGDHAAAKEILEQMLELVPGWAPAWLAFGVACEKLGRPAEARSAYERAAALDPEGTLGTPMHLARIGAQPAPPSAPESYLRGLFDQYAARFDDHLLGRLAYRGPVLLEAALASIGASRFSTVIDLGCGTGLCGARFRAASEHLCGVDLSPRMIEAARRKNIYDRLEIGANDVFLRREPAASASLVLAADVLVYTGDLGPVLAAVAHVLEPGGRVALTLQRAETAAFVVGPDLRFSHGEAHVEKAAASAGLEIAFCAREATRIDGGVAVPGLVIVATRTVSSRPVSRAPAEKM